MRGGSISSSHLGVGPDAVTYAPRPNVCHGEDGERSHGAADGPLKARTGRDRHAGAAVSCVEDDAWRLLRVRRRVHAHPKAHPSCGRVHLELHHDTLPGHRAVVNLEPRALGG
uniref:Uncharacterized protein n=1 Tax=Tetraselmis sp. GSL018 TaxID=582737 RepID=A0A061RTF7_9CHLO